MRILFISTLGILLCLLYVWVAITLIYNATRYGSDFCTVKDNLFELYCSTTREKAFQYTENVVCEKVC